MIYPALRRALFAVPPERIHTVVFAGLRAATRPAVLRKSLSRRLAAYDPALSSTVFGVRFPAPLGLAAGFDKDGLGVHTWGALGFGYAELGTVTVKPQPGNPAPRMFRLPADRALLNRMGFNNYGAGALAAALTGAAPEVPIGVNIGKNKDTSPEQAPGEYARCARVLGPLCAYLVVNVSSPNTPGCAICNRRSPCARSWRRCWRRRRRRYWSRSHRISPTPTSTKSPIWQSNWA